MIVAGVGLSSTCPAEELADLVRRAQGLAGRPVAVLAAPVWKTQARCFSDLARMLGLPVVAVSPPGLAEVADRVVTHSAASRAATGLGSVAEAAALAAAGPGARLALARIASAHATCALAEGARP